MQGLRKHLSEEKHYPVYLFYGQEKTLLAKMLPSLTKKLIGEDLTMNYQSYDSTTYDADRVSDAIRTLPFFADKRVIVLKYLKLFNGRNKNIPEFVLKLLSEAPSSSIVILLEDEVDKRTALFKFIQKNGFIDEFTTPLEGDLVKMIGKKFASYQKKIELNTAHYLISYVGSDYGTLENEMHKLAMYAETEIITIEMIEAVCVRNLEHIIFDLVGLLGKKERDKALLMYDDMIHSKQPPMMILFMLVRQLRQLMMTKQIMNEGLQERSVAEQLKIQPFVAKKLMEGAQYFQLSTLKDALKDCASVENDIKSGRIDDVFGIETILLKYCH